MAPFAVAKVATTLLGLWTAPGDASKMKTESSLARLTTGLMSNLKISHEMLSPYNLKGIEASLLAIGARNSQASDRQESSDLNAFLLQIADLIGQMKNQIKDQKASSQISLDNAVSDLSNCSLNSTSSSLSFWRTTHNACRNSESALGQRYNDCLASLAIDDQTVNARYQNFQAQNTWPNSCTYSPSSTASIGSSDRRRSNRDTLIAIQNSFQTKAANWRTAYDNLMNATAARNITRADCVQKLYAYRRETSRCNAIQNDLEVHACGGSQACDTYTDCYRCKSDHWRKTNTSVASSEASWLAEWQGILRIECLIAEINSTATFNAAACNTDYSGSLSSEVRIRYEDPSNVPAMVSCSATSGGQVPGSAAFIEAYYTPMPAHTTPAKCKASCCVYTDGCCYSFKYESNLACCLETQDRNQSTCSTTAGFGSTAGWVTGACPRDADAAYALVTR
eukprot:TRINITY_DN944_c1_g1_i1.p1 TRINITY_DN944_c1_g1~~TRINITY_DN944_c1_g1_i1.p1  ORF type:complete len:468 (+),score=79.45 TRINITY_DN944_c1_g1_i1:51-1406(+)